VAGGRLEIPTHLLTMNELLELAPAPSFVNPGNHRPDEASQPGGPETFTSARAYFVHAQALIDEGVSVGKGSRIWAFAHLATGAVIGADCNICDHTFLEGGVRLGQRVTVKCGVYLWNGVVVEDDVFIGPAAVFTNDDRPCSKKYLAEDLTTLLREGCSIGANSTTLPNVTIGRWAMVGAGAVVTHDVPDHALVVGNPARWRAWVCRCGEKLTSVAGGLLHCTCGRSYEQIAEREIRAIATNGPVRSWNGNNGAALSAAIITSNGPFGNNGHTKPAESGVGENTPWRRPGLQV
jgi:acetyltransferase-like isoleucine patch superfamily enzyme